MEINNYLYQSENLLNTRQDCVLTIDLIDYSVNDNILINEEENIVWTKSLISKIEFEDIEFDLILDYPVILKANNMEKIGKDYIKLKHSKNNTVLEVSLEIEDIKKRVGFVERLLSGKEVFKDTDHLLMKLYNEFKGSGMDLIHLEILISNIVRDKSDLSKSARLNKNYNPILINMKDIVFRGGGFVQSLAFENIGKSINTGLISDVYDDPSILERVLTGTIVEEKKK